jgi:hypothetical protein
LQVEQTTSTTAGGAPPADLNLPILQPKSDSHPTAASSEANSPLSEKGRELVRRFDEQSALKHKPSSKEDSSTQTQEDEQYGAVASIDPHWYH